MKFISDSPSQTKKLGVLLAKEILKTELKKSLVIALKGDLGAGKTTFIQGIAHGLNVKNRIMSPTFIVFRRYSVGKRNIQHLFHMDAYRIKKLRELEHIDFKEMLALPETVVLIEWAEKIKKALPRRTVWLEFGHGRKENERIISIKR